MKMMYLLLFVAVLFIVLRSTKEGFVDYGFSGWKKPVPRLTITDGKPVDTSTLRRDLTVLSPDTIGGIVNAVAESAKQTTNMCFTPIETIYINKYSGESGDFFDSRIMFYCPNNYFTVELISQVRAEGTGYRVTSMRTQVPSNDANGPSGFANDTGSVFVSHDELLKTVSPSNSAMNAVLKALEKNN
tara:strand:- start:13676 stop:14236 length:561 start_codon:yes stop_codon:yes gene_type:complete